MGTTGLNNLEQYFTIMYTVPFPRHRLQCSEHCTKSKTILCSSSAASLSNSGSCPKCVRSCGGWLIVFLKTHVCKNGSNLPSDFVLSKTPLWKTQNN